MSSPEPGGQPRPLRVAGLTLVAVALIAVAAGLISVWVDGGDGGSGDGGGTAQPPDTSVTAGPSDSPAPSPSGPAAPTTSDPGAVPTTQPGAPAPTTQPGAPAPTSASPAPGTQPPPAAPPPPVRVYNNSLIEGLANKAANDFRGAGWLVVEVSNYSGGTIPTSTVYYRPGTNEEAAARTLGNQFDLRVEPRFPGIAEASPGLIVIVTNDYGTK